MNRLAIAAAAFLALGTPAMANTSFCNNSLSTIGIVTAPSTGPFNMVVMGYSMRLTNLTNQEVVARVTAATSQLGGAQNLTSTTPIRIRANLPYGVPIAMFRGAAGSTPPSASAVLAAVRVACGP